MLLLHSKQDLHVFPPSAQPLHTYPNKRSSEFHKINSKQYSDAALAEHACASFLNCFLNSQAKYKKTQLSTSLVNLKMSISSVHCLCRLKTEIKFKFPPSMHPLNLVVKEDL